MSPTTSTSGWPGSVRSPRTRSRPASSTLTPAASASAPASGDAATPAAHSTVRAGHVGDPVTAQHRDAVRVHVAHRGARAHVDAQPLEVAGRAAPQRLRVVGQQAGPGLEQRDPRGPGVDGREVTRQGTVRELGDLPRRARRRSRRRRRRRSLSHAVALGRVAGELRPLEGAEHRERIPRASASVLSAGACSAQASWPA